MENPYEKYKVSSIELDRLHKVGRAAKKSGDIKLYEDCKNRILYSLAAWAYARIYTKYTALREENDDLVQEFIFRCVQHYDKYKPSMSRITTYFCWNLICVITKRNRIVEREQKVRLSAIEKHKSKPIFVIDKHSWLMSYDEVKHLLNPRHVEIFEHLIFGGLTLKETGELYGITKERVRQIKDGIANKLGALIIYRKHKYDIRKSGRDNTTTEQQQEQAVLV